jgi:hypothetical protein
MSLECVMQAIANLGRGILFIRDANLGPKITFRGQPFEKKDKSGEVSRDERSVRERLQSGVKNTDIELSKRRAGGFGTGRRKCDA